MSKPPIQYEDTGRFTSPAKRIVISPEAEVDVNPIEVIWAGERDEPSLLISVHLAHDEDGVDRREDVAEWLMESLNSTWKDVPE